MNKVIGIISDNLSDTTFLFESVINSLNVKSDQEHIKFDMFIDSDINNISDDEALSLVKKFDVTSDFLIILVYNKDLALFIKNNTSLDVIECDTLDDYKDYIIKLYKGGIL